MRCRPLQERATCPSVRHARMHSDPGQLGQIVLKIELIWLGTAQSCSVHCSLIAAASASCARGVAAQGRRYSPYDLMPYRHRSPCNDGALACRRVRLASGPAKSAGIPAGTVRRNGRGLPRHSVGGRHTDKKQSRPGVTANRLCDGSRRPVLPVAPQRLRLDQSSFLSCKQALVVSNPVVACPDPAAICSSVRTHPVQAAWCVSARP